jgi:hypothetical protein
MSSQHGCSNPGLGLLIDALVETERVEAASLEEELEDMEVLKGILALSGDLWFRDVFDVIFIWSSARLSETGVSEDVLFGLWWSL